MTACLFPAILPHFALLAARALAGAANATVRIACGLA
jgi:hypothetical protein